MNMLARRRRQQGLTFLGLLMLGIIVALVALVGMKVVPTYIEYMAIQRAVDRSGVGGSVLEIQQLFERSAAVDDITSIGPKDLVINKVGDRFDVSYEYEKRIPLFGPASLLLEYKGKAKR